MAGRRPEPLEKRIGKGNPGRRPLPENVPARINGQIVPPTTLSKIAADAWPRFSQVLSQRGQLSIESYWSLVAVCECFAEWEELRADIQAKGRTQTVETTAGGAMERQRPQVGMFQDADRRLKGWLIEFGLTDASRGKVRGEGPPEEDDPLKEFGIN